MNDFLSAPRPIRSVLIANRGEIACRVIKTASRLGLRSVAVYSDADADALHVRLADDVVRIGPAAPSESYLNIDAILHAAAVSGAEAIHPGYGFLSENPAFVRAVEAAGLAFVGPSSDAVEIMGSKILARGVAQKAGVPVVPGFDGPNATDADFAKAADEIGYPVLVKASAGGGGRGMRRVMKPADLQAALDSARSEAVSAFGDPTVFLEKLILDPRHLEVQVFGDGRGNVLHFHERDCSVQRNHQKIIEEAPAPNLPDAVRQVLFDHAVNLAAAIDYAGAGTVEFVMQAGSNEPYFLEMNTRLQVEHPVTEAICGVDLVGFQLRQAAGFPLPFTQDNIRPKGHAIEVRLNAERPEAGFLPDVGRIEYLAMPPRTRFDSGVETGSVVSSHYDSMLAKLIVHGADREAARSTLKAALDGAVLSGVGSNLAFLADSLDAPSFAEGRATTGFLAETFPEGWQPDPDKLLRLRGHAALASIANGRDPVRRTDGFRIGRSGEPGKAPLFVEDEYGDAEIELRFGDELSVREGDREVALGDPPAWLAPVAGRIGASAHGLNILAAVRPLAEMRMEARADGNAPGAIAAPLTGLVTVIHVAEGDAVLKGQPLIVMEAMKLVHTLTAPFDGTVTRVAAGADKTVAAKTILIELEETA
jgi:3-methylcrotonyl-CoA carboxylase alpha subunit